MIYALNVNDAARATLTTLPLDLQEAVWDLLEQVVRDAAGRTSRASVEAEAHHVILRSSGGEESLVNVALVVDHGSRTVSLVMVSITD